MKDGKTVTQQKLYIATNAVWSAAYDTVYYTVNTAAYYAVNAANAAWATSASYAASTAADAVAYSDIISNINNINNYIKKYLQILLRKTKQFQNNKILEQISKTDVDKLELVDWNMITDIMQEEYDIVHEFDYEDIFSRRCLIELLRREYV